MSDNKHVFAPGFELPPYWMKGKVVVLSFVKDDSITEISSFSGITKQNELTLTADGLEDFTFPIDPFIGIGFKNLITRRTVAKGKNRGTVKERWTEDDADISISGVFISDDGKYPLEVDQLRRFFMQHKSVAVKCTLLNDIGIENIAIESYDLPFTKGEENQAFEIKAYSDDVVQLLTENN